MMLMMMMVMVVLALAVPVAVAVTTNRPMQGGGNNDDNDDDDHHHRGEVSGKSHPAASPFFRPFVGSVRQSGGCVCWTVANGKPQTEPAPHHLLL